MSIHHDDLPPTADGAPQGELRARLMRPERVPRVPWVPVLLAAIVGLLLGSGGTWPWLGAARARADEAEQEVAAVRAEAQLATAIIAAQAGDGATAVDHARDFYVKAEQAVAGEVGGPRRVAGTPPVRAALQRALGERDTVLALLAAGDARGTDRLRERHAAMRQAIRGPIAPGARADFRRSAP